jgi:LmbE family N-acetylglucosaminyl deacetylase
MISFRPVKLSSVVVLGAHCDDIAIGAGGTLLRLAERNPGLTIRALVLSGGGTTRESEERAALADFAPGADLTLTILDLPDGRFPAHWAAVKSALEDLRTAGDPDLILAPWMGDAHQDHRLVGEIVPTVFRGQVALSYEIVKWEGDLGHPNVYHPLDDELAERKCALLDQHYLSQHDHSWYDREMFLGIARIRGVECGARYAEAFHATKLVLELSGA